VFYSPLEGWTLYPKDGVDKLNISTSPALTGTPYRSSTPFGYFDYKDISKGFTVGSQPNFTSRGEF